MATIEVSKKTLDEMQRFAVKCYGHHLSRAAVHDLYRMVHGLKTSLRPWPPGSVMRNIAFGWKDLHNER